jgi:alpha-tubulin suppressor-like RCC1 family protein
VAVKRGFVWVGLLAVWGCADFNKEEDAYCRDNPAICDEQITTVRMVASREQHNLAVDTDGRVWAWGENPKGQLGDGTLTLRTRPTRIQDLSGIETVAAGAGHSLAKGGEGKVWRWGQIGSGTLRKTPEEIPGVDDAAAIAAGNAHSLILHQSGAVSFWGVAGANQETDTPTVVPGLPRIASIAAGGAHSLALDDNGDVWAWGNNEEFQLGREDGTVRLTPAKVLGLPRIKVIAAGFTHSLALGVDNTIWTWGANSHGQLGDGSKGGKRALPKQIAAEGNIVELAAGTFHSLARNATNDVMVWGRNSAGQLGNNDVQLLDQLSPMVIRLTNAKFIAAGHSHSMAVLNNGCLMAWGSNRDGRLGIDPEWVKEIAPLLAGLKLEGIIPFPLPVSVSCTPVLPNAP